MMVLATTAQKNVPMVRKQRTRVCGTTVSFPRFTILTRVLRSCGRLPGKYLSRWRRSRFSGRRQCHLYRGIRGSVKGDRTDYVAVFDQHPRPEQKCCTVNHPCLDCRQLTFSLRALLAFLYERDSLAPLFEKSV